MEVKKNCMTHRVRYSEIDGHGIVYNSHYLEWFEMGRTELLRSTGMSYKVFLEQGISLPVIEAYVKYHRPIFYDEIVNIQTFVKEPPRATIKIHCEIIVDDELRANGYTVHAFIKNNVKPTRPPKEFVQRIISNTKSD